MAIRARSARRGWGALATSVALVAASVALVVVTGAVASAHPPPLPDSMAAIGDSITQAANLDGAHFGPSFPDHSWSTGADRLDPLASHYERLLAANPALAGRGANLGASSARMRDAPAQAERAVARGADYVTVLMGGNDVCASSKESMTPVAAYEASFRQAMDILAEGLPGARVYVVSVPDVYQLWSVHKDKLAAVLTWELFGICRSMLALANSEADRQLVRARNMAFNEVLARVCAPYPRCRYDGGRVFAHRFGGADVSTLDYFHPSATGQATLAEISWGAGFWPGL